MSNNNIEITIKAIDQASAALKSVGNSLKNIGNSSTEINKVSSSLSKLSSSSFGGISSGLIAIANGFKSIITQAAGFATAQIALNGLSVFVEAAKNSVFGYNDEMMRAQISFETMFKGSKEAARAFMDDLDKFNERTPFEMPDVQRLSQLLLNAGWAARDVIPTMTALGNAAAASGKGAEGLQRITLALSQIKQKGRVQQEELLQLMEAGVSAAPILAEKLKLTGDQIANIGKHSINADVAIKALVEGINERYGGLMERLNDTLTTQVSTIKDNFSAIGAAIGKPIYTALVETLKEINVWTSKVKAAIKVIGFEETFKIMIPPEWQKNLKEVYKSLMDCAEAFKTMAREARETGNALDFFGIASSAVNLTVQTLAASMNILSASMLGIRYGVKYLEQGIRDVAAGAEQTIVNFENKSKRIGKFVYDMMTFSGYKEAKINFDISKNSPPSVNNENRGYSEFGDASETNVSKFPTFKKAIGHADKTPFGYNASSNSDKYGEFSGQSTPSSVNSGGGGRSEDKVFKLANRIQDAFNDLNQKIISETGSSYQLGMSKINDEIDKMQRELVGKGKMEGLDTSALEAKIGEYQNIMTEPIKRAWRDAWTGMRNDTNLIMAKMRDDKKAQAEAEFQIAVAGIEKEKEARLKALGTGDPVTDMQARIAVENEVGLKISQAKKERDDKERQAEIEKYNMRIEYNQLELDLNLKTQEEIDRLNRKELENKKKYLQEQFADERKSFAERYELRKQLAETEKSIQNTPLSGLEGFMSGLKQTSDSFGTWARNMQEVGRQTATAMQSSFQEFFFDAMTGQLKDLGDYVKSFLQGIVRAISSALANAFSQKIISSILGGGQESSSGGGFLSAITSLFGFRADGGSVYAGRPYIVGERGPEVFMSHQSGTIIPNHALAIGGQSGAAAPIVNVYNNSTAEKTEVRQETKWDGKRWVVNVVLEAIVNNTGGMRDLLTSKGRAY